MLELRDLAVSYAGVPALRGVSLDVETGECVAIVGANGAGKTTLLRAISGLVPSRGRRVFEGRDLASRRPHEVAALGVAHVPEGRRLFPSLTVEENLLAGGYAGRAGDWDLERVYALFPALRARRDARPDALSGGEQQMAAIGRALMANPRLLACDEVSLGLASVVVRDLYRGLATVVAAGLSVIVVEQDVSLAQRMSARLYCFQEGRVSLHGASAALTRAQISHAYFGV